MAVHTCTSAVGGRDGGLLGLLTDSLAVSETLSQGNEVERHTQTQQWFEICFLCGLRINKHVHNSKSLILTVA